MTAASPAEQRAGFTAGVLAYAWWGFVPLYLKLLSFADLRDLVAERVLWCVPTALIAVWLTSGWRAGWASIRAALAPATLRPLALSALFIFCNWLLYTWLILHDRVIEGALAYFIAPLASVCVGVMFFGEKINRLQLCALVLAGAGVLVQAIALGAPPWFALGICTLWIGFIIVRKRTSVPAATGLLVESVVMAPLAIALLIWTHASVPGGLAHTPTQLALLAFSGVVTAMPLMLFAFSARRTSLTALGLVQFLAPSLQFLSGLALGEPFTPGRALSFALIWLGLIAYGIEMVLRARAAPRTPAPSTPQPAQSAAAPPIAQIPE